MRQVDMDLFPLLQTKLRFHLHRQRRCRCILIIILTIPTSITRLLLLLLLLLLRLLILPLKRSRLLLPFQRIFVVLQTHFKVGGVHSFSESYADEGFSACFGIGDAECEVSGGVYDGHDPAIHFVTRIRKIHGDIALSKQIRLRRPRRSARLGTVRHDIDAERVVPPQGFEFAGCQWLREVPVFGSVAIGRLHRRNPVDERFVYLHKRLLHHYFIGRVGHC
mmetsp:Transcript_5628/g.11656  ORF Transcript_5628/g.11656 Transcript_5628/m.11656 type:complete len:221 (+) Transcript_5628:368-1030(+)